MLHNRTLVRLTQSLQLKTTFKPGTTGNCLSMHHILSMSSKKICFIKSYLLSISCTEHRNLKMFLPPITVGVLGTIILNF